MTLPDFSFEDRWIELTGGSVAGVDEAGRGPLAGPVVAAAIVLNRERAPQGIRDSKLLSETERERLFDEIVKTAHVGIASVPPSIIDDLNIRGATLRAMSEAIASLAIIPSAVLTDGRDQPTDRNTGLPFSGEAIIKGDQKSVSVAAASIVAKVTRDRMMVQLAERLPEYGFEKHKGYPTAAHLRALAEHGPTPFHRKSFKPVKILGPER
ncbi:MAG: ribonuclease HII [Pseudomonadota bacterium]